MRDEVGVRVMRPRDVCMFGRVSVHRVHLNTCILFVNLGFATERQETQEKTLRYCSFHVRIFPYRPYHNFCCYVYLYSMSGVHILLLAEATDDEHLHEHLHLIWCAVECENFARKYGARYSYVCAR